MLEDTHQDLTVLDLAADSIHRPLAVADGLIVLIRLFC